MRGALQRLADCLVIAYLLGAGGSASLCKAVRRRLQSSGFAGCSYEFSLVTFGCRERCCCDSDGRQSWTHLHSWWLWIYRTIELHELRSNCAILRHAPLGSGRVLSQKKARRTQPMRRKHR